MNYIDTQNLNSYSIKAKDGEIGHITDFYFDEDLFYLRYLVVDTELFLARNLVLVSPISFHNVDLKNKEFEVFMTKEEVEDLPSFDSVVVVSREYEKAYNYHFVWPYYWGMASSAWAIGPYGLGGMEYPFIGKNFDSEAPKYDRLEDAKNSGLRSSTEIRSYSIEGTDGKFGHVKGFILNPTSFSIDFLVIDTIDYIPSKNVLLRPEWLEQISWDKKTVKFSFTKDLIKSAPAYTNGEMNKDFIKKIDQHFNFALNEISNYKVKTSVDDIFGVKKNRNQIDQSL